MSSVLYHVPFHPWPLILFLITFYENLGLMSLQEEKRDCVYFPNKLYTFLSKHVKEISTEFYFIAVFIRIEGMIKRIVHAICCVLTIVNCLLMCFIIFDYEFFFTGILSWDSYEARIEKVFLKSFYFSFCQVPQRLFQPRPTFMLISLLRGSWILWAM